jgi:hypothetical protein
VNFGASGPRIRRAVRGGGCRRYRSVTEARRHDALLLDFESTTYAAAAGPAAGTARHWNVPLVFRRRCVGSTALSEENPLLALSCQEERNRAGLLCPGSPDVNLLGYDKSVIDLNAKIRNRAFVFLRHIRPVLLADCQCAGE